MKIKNILIFLMLLVSFMIPVTSAKTILTEELIAGNSNPLADQIYLITYTDGTYQYIKSHDFALFVKTHMKTLSTSIADSKEVVSVIRQTGQEDTTNYRLWTGDNMGSCGEDPNCQPAHEPTYVYSEYKTPTNNGVYWTSSESVALDFGLKLGTLPSNAVLPCDIIERKYGDALIEYDQNGDRVITGDEHIRYVERFYTVYEAPAALYIPEEARAIKAFVDMGCALSMAGTPIPTPTPIIPYEVDGDVVPPTPEDNIIVKFLKWLISLFGG